jgi:hypothetical protein
MKSCSQKRKQNQKMKVCVTLYVRSRSITDNCSWHYMPYTLSVKLSDFTVWCHTWRKNLVNNAFLKGNSAGLITVLSSRLSHRTAQFTQEISQIPQFTCRHHDVTRTRRDTERTKKLKTVMGNLCSARVHSVQFFVQFFTQLNSRRRNVLLTEHHSIVKPTWFTFYSIY